jgi:outer membrane lipoprotein-sorting protein
MSTHNQLANTGGDSLNSLEARLNAMSQSLARSLRDGDAEFVSGVTSRIKIETIEPLDANSLRTHRWLTRGTVGRATAAAVVIAIGIWFWLTPSAPPAFAMDAVSKRLFALDSLHIKGAIYPPDGSAGRPIEIFAQKPDHCRVVGRLTFDSSGAKPGEVIINAERCATIDPATKTATIVRENDDDAKSRVAEILQGLGPLMFGQDAGFSKVRSEALGGIATDVYESKIDPHARVTVWLNAATGLPAKTELAEVSQAGEKHLAAMFDTIEANPTFADDLFTPTFGPGWTVTFPKSAPPDLSLSQNSAWFGGMGMGLRHCLSLGNGDVLICWCLFESNHPDQDMALPGDAMKSLTFSSPGNIVYTEQQLHADLASTGYHWRWSLLRPQRPINEPAGILTVAAQTARGDSGQLTNAIVTCDRNELPQRILDLQKQTLPAGQIPLTLEQIEAASSSTPRGDH